MGSVVLGDSDLSSNGQLSRCVSCLVVRVVGGMKQVDVIIWGQSVNGVYSTKIAFIEVIGLWSAQVLPASDLKAQNVSPG